MEKRSFVISDVESREWLGVRVFWSADRQAVSVPERDLWRAAQGHDPVMSLVGLRAHFEFVEGHWELARLERT